jgi:hypothetical protein
MLDRFPSRYTFYVANITLIINKLDRLSQITGKGHAQWL